MSRKTFAEIMEKLTNSDIDSKLVKEENSKLIEEIKQLKDKIKKKSQCDFFICLKHVESLICNYLYILN